MFVKTVQFQVYV